MLAVPLPEAERAGRCCRHRCRSRRSTPTTSASSPDRPTTSLRCSERLAADEVTPTLIPLAAAAHSSMLDPVLPEFLEVVREVELSPPQLPYLSNLTGTWITAEQATDPQYWVDHLRDTVRFADACATVLADGPDWCSSSSAPATRSRRTPAARPSSRSPAIPALRHPNQDDGRHGVHAATRSPGAGPPASTSTSTGSPATAGASCACPATRSARSGTGSSPADRRSARCRPSLRSLPLPRRPIAAPAAREPARIADLADSFWAPALARA